jgi:hypothetical protein
MNCCEYQCDQSKDCPAHTNPTTRTYPRTLVEAFPQDAPYQPVIERVRYSNSNDLWLMLVAAFCAGVIVTLMLVRS